MAVGAGCVTSVIAIVLHAHPAVVFSVGAIVCAAVAIGMELPYRRQRRINAELRPEWDGNRLRLVLVNRGIRAEVAVSIVSFTDERGEVGPYGAWLVGRQIWPVPWAEDRSTGPKEVLRNEPRVLDLATFKRAFTEQEAVNGK